MRIKNYLFSLFLVVLLVSCKATKDIPYFQDVPSDGKISVTTPQDIKVQSDDKISIVVNSKDRELEDLFNLSTANKQLGSTVSSTTGGQVSAYTVKKEGTIDFPVLGEIAVAGKTREEISTYIKNELISKNLVKDPIVTVEFLNLTVSVIGEVANPGRYNIDKDQLTLLDAISMAGDLTIFGKREKVMVMREENGVQHVYNVNLLSAENVYSSPVYYLQQNDVVYVEPNSTKARQSTVNENTVRSTSFWISIVSLLSTLTVLVVNLK